MLGPALAVRFGLEVCLTAVTAWFAYELSPGWLGLLLSLLCVGLLLVSWGALLSPKRAVEIGRLPRLVLELALFGLAAAALESRGHWQLGIVLSGVWLTDKIALACLER